jgi:Flp pilus assembly protein TadG
MRSFFSLMNRFRRDQRGNIVVIFGIVLVPLVTFMGMAIDYSRLGRARATMQSVLDSVSLMVAKDYSSNLITQGQINQKAQAYFSALYTDQETQAVSVSATYTVANASSGSTIKVNGSAMVPTDFMQLVGFHTMSFNVSSTSTWGTSLLRIALVLDTTGSMSSSGKMTALKPAATALVSQLSGLARNPGDVYISVVPFEANVNVGSFNGVSNTSATWLRWDEWDPVSSPACNGPNRSVQLWSPNLAKAECDAHNAMYGTTWNHTMSTKNPPSHSQWNGCVSDRDQNYDISSTAPSSNATNFYANQEFKCPSVPVLPMTNNWTNVNSAINALVPNGGTNQTIGLLWGWLSLLQQSPLNAPAEDPNNKYQHIIILFTDGLNTMDRWYGDGSDTSTQVDGRMTQLCQAITHAGVTIYAVQIDTDGSGQSAVLPTCAGPGNFFMLTKASQIQAAFQQIGTSISELRVAQ